VAEPVIDIAIVVVYLAALAGIGVVFSRRQATLEDFFFAGRSMTWLPIGLSLMAALNSGMDYLMQPASTIRYGLVLLVGTLSWPILYPWVTGVTLPFYRRVGVSTPYEYLEARFDVRVRCLAAAIFVVWRLGWMATAIYVPCLAINAATGAAYDIRVMIVVLGALVTGYTMLGGIKAVIWNDVLQFAVMFAGLAATVTIAVHSVPGGIGEVWQAASVVGGSTAVSGDAAGSSGLAAFFARPITVPAILAAMVVGRMAQYTGDQVMVQRFQTTRSLRDARQAFVVNAAGDVVWMAGLSFVGVALFAYFQHHPLPAGLGPDDVVPAFMARAFPAGAVGLVIAAILAASLSSIDSAINAGTSVVVVDFYQRLWRRSGRGGRSDVFVARVATTLLGMAGTALAVNVSRIGTLLEIANRLVNAFTGPLLGIFLLAMFSRRARSGGVLVAGLVGSLVSYWVAYHSAIGFMWPSSFGLAATLAVGAALSFGRRPDAGVPLTYAAVMAGQDASRAGVRYNSSIPRQLCT